MPVVEALIHCPTGLRLGKDHRLRGKCKIRWNDFEGGEDWHGKETGKRDGDAFLRWQPGRAASARKRRWKGVATGGIMTLHKHTHAEGRHEML